MEEAFEVELVLSRPQNKKDEGHDEYVSRGNAVEETKETTLFFVAA